jgi:predicted SnoaL-like aldol condensation-catalyzing enzyme
MRSVIPKEKHIEIGNIKTLICCATVLMTVLALGGCQVGEDPQAVLEAANLEKALYCMDILENRPDLEPSRRIDILRNECFAETYIQHSPHVQDGRDTVLSLFANRYMNFPETSISIKRAASEGDLVWIHQHVKRTPDDPGRAVVNIFRMEDGKFAEHWNVVQAVPEKSKNNNTMF